MRSIIKDEVYFASLLKRLEALLQKSYQRINDGQVAPERLQPYKRGIFSNQLHFLIAKYSGGLSIDELKASNQHAIDLISEIWPDDGSEAMPDFLKDWYVHMEWMLSFGIFLNISDEDFAKVVGVWDKTGRRDWLIDYLIAHRIPDRPIVDTLIFPKPYAALKKAVEESDPQKRSAIVKHYLEKEWYAGQKGVYWYDDHKNAHDIFFGYWSFESAAVVKIAGIDDSSFRDNMYYPKDLL
jgi:hypothetical protein